MQDEAPELIPRGAATAASQEPATAIPQEPAAVASPEAPSIGPVTSAERIQIVDILRGFAILGIFAVNMGAFSMPWMLGFVMPDYWTGWYDRIAEFLVIFLFQGKFYTLFSFLFGMGLAIQMGRVESRGGRFVPLYVRRLLALLLIGLAHAFLIWMGDILVTYALLGFVLLLFRGRSEHTLAAWIAVCLLLPVLIIALGVVAGAQGWKDFEVEKQTVEMNEGVEDSLRIYAGGTFGEIMEQRALDTFVLLSFLPLAGGHILAMFLSGLFAGRRRLFEEIPAHLPLLRRVRNWGLLLGLAGNLVVALTFRSINPVVPTLAGLGMQICYLIGTTSLCLFYISTITLLAQRETWRRRLGPLASVGRTALSNYLLQSILGTLIFYSYGLGLYGKVGPAAGLLLVFVIYAMQVPLSGWWLRRFRFGPAEWAWRSLTYAKPQPMRL